MKHLLNKCFAVASLLICISNTVLAQNTALQAAKNKLNLINKVLDSSEYLSFDVEINYWSDSVKGRRETDYKLASYSLHRGNLYVNVGGTEYMQNDSISVTVYNDPQMIMATYQRMKRTSNMFPLQNFSDSVLNYIGNYYTITDHMADSSTGEIIFTSDSIGVPYKSISIQYAKRHYLPLQMNMVMAQPFNNEDAVFIDSANTDSTYIPPVMVNKYITMKFINYSLEEKSELFDPVRYMLYDRERKTYKASEKYAGYKLYASTFNYTTKEFNDTELPVKKPNPGANTQ